MNELFDLEAMAFLERAMDTLILTGINDNPFLLLVRMLCYIFSLLLFLNISIKMFLGEKALNVAEVLRPFAIGLVIFAWPSFMTAILAPTKLVADSFRSYAFETGGAISAAHTTRSGLQYQVEKKLSEIQADVDAIVQEDGNDGFMGMFNIDFTDVFAEFRDLKYVLWAQFKLAAYNMLDFVMQTLMKTAAWVMVFIQGVFTFVLATVGPFSFAFSILPAYRTAWINWLSKFLSVSFYTPLTYLVITASSGFIKFNLDREIEQLQWVLRPENSGSLIEYASRNDSTIVYVTMSYIIVLIGLASVPVMSGWIVPNSSSAGAFSGARKQSIGRVIK